MENFSKNRVGALAEIGVAVIMLSYLTGEKLAGCGERVAKSGARAV